MENGLTHFDKEGNAVMVDVSGKNVTYRTAMATGYIAVGPEIMAMSLAWRGWLESWA